MWQSDMWHIIDRNGYGEIGVVGVIFVNRYLESLFE